MLDLLVAESNRSNLIHCVRLVLERWVRCLAANYFFRQERMWQQSATTAVDVSGAYAGNPGDWRNRLAFISRGVAMYRKLGEQQL